MMEDNTLEAEEAGTTMPADADTPQYVAQGDDDHSHTHEHGALGRHSHRHGHTGGEQEHNHDQKHPLHAEHADHALYHPGG